MTRWGERLPLGANQVRRGRVREHKAEGAAIGEGSVGREAVGAKLSRGAEERRSGGRVAHRGLGLCGHFVGSKVGGEGERAGSGGLVQGVEQAQGEGDGAGGLAGQQRYRNGVAQMSPLSQARVG